MQKKPFNNAIQTLVGVAGKADKNVSTNAKRGHFPQEAGRHHLTLATQLKHQRRPIVISISCLMQMLGVGLRQGGCECNGRVTIPSYGKMPEFALLADRLVAGPKVQA